MWPSWRSIYGSSSAGLVKSAKMAGGKSIDKIENSFVDGSPIIDGIRIKM